MTPNLVRVLVVDDEDGVRALLSETLRLAGFSPSGAGTGNEAIQLVRKEDFDLVLLDVNLPLMDGFETLTKLRLTHPTLPVIMISARQDKADVIEGLRLGADDYITKPFSIEEVAMRVNTVLRRTRLDQSNLQLQVGPLKLSLDTYEVWFKNEAIQVSRTEFNLLKALMENKGRVMTKDQLLREVWGYDFMTSTNVVDTYISYLRRKLHRESFTGIKTVRGVGFQLREK